MEEKKKNPISADQYSLIVNRRQAFDTLIWQTPVLSLTAQAFLFSVSLTSGNSNGARIISAFLSFITALASIQLMYKHRYYEERDSKNLEKYEDENHIYPIHSIDDLKDKPWYIRQSSFDLWLLTLALFALSAMVVILDVVCSWKWI